MRNTRNDLPRFKDSFSLEKRLLESNRILEKYRDRIPCIIEIDRNSHLQLDKKKFLVPNDITIGQFLYVVRKRVDVKKEESLFLFTNNILPPSSKLLLEIYKEYRDEDNFLYFILSSENTFGRIKKVKV